MGSFFPGGGRAFFDKSMKVNICRYDLSLMAATSYEPPLHGRVKMLLRYDGFFSFAVVRQIDNLFYFDNIYSMVIIDFTMSAFAIERRGIAVAIKQAIIETAAASKMEIIGTAPNCRILLVAASMNTEQI